ncbi:hypothetical protein NBO_1055g0001 [Nosema bombycis CQ1]|uniref:Nuclear pore protein n=1 Tax=Nosema bombycis (strain CQ1 / CVCC 102059) TaxID=578461 RepID=R0MFN1_NOSB1|nr:hypothetical protein NBO_1055g0001 [Nosema bombycis CQ1]|eukprot:EOB11568.1 hypothetical protein NBO_1055g0001 [Nosema bombycis CQ1]
MRINISQNFIKIPFILRNTKINNYFQVITELKKIQKKNKKYFTPIKSQFTKVLKERISDFDIHQIVDGFVHQKLKEIQFSQEKQIEKSFFKDLRVCLENIKKENELLSLTTNKIIGNVKEFETWFKEGPNDLLFNNIMLFDLFTFLSNTKPTEDFDQEIAYLGIEYYKFIERYLKENHSKNNFNIHNLEDKISLFVRLKFNREELHLDVFEDQYIFAEIYVYLRCGFTAPVYKIFDKYRAFFQSVDLDFKNHFTSWLVSKTKPPVYSTNDNEDQFKRFLISLMQGNVPDNSSIISSVEDFLWTNLMCLEQSSINNLISKFDGYNSPKGLLLVYILTKQYYKAMVYLLKMDINVYPTYYLMRELAKKSGNGKVDGNKVDGSKLDNINDTSSFSTKKPFVDFVFLIASKMSDTQNKSLLISSLADVVDDYHEIVPQMIVKTKQYDLLGEMYLDSRINSNVVNLLMKSNDRKQLLHVHHVIEDQNLLMGILVDVLVEGILTNTNVDEYLEISEKMKVKTKDNKLEVLKMFYLFTKTPDLVTLKRTSLFSLNFKLIEVKFVVEKILRMACEIIKKANDHEMAKKLFKIVGDLELSDGCIKYINRELILYI